ncbi:unnamed protein product [Ilex paraguariensis]|uniref:non-specific serine/threonine protein kinase n=1 Tax=Ilex paraguariensis TaxID=185542 RepID=A0ABC8SGH8_9AQUA
MSTGIAKHDTALVAALDGTVHFLDLNSMKPLWSFTSGPEIYSSYQAPLDHDNDKENASGMGSGFFMDCGDDWELYAHDRLGPPRLDPSLFVWPFLHLCGPPSDSTISEVSVEIKYGSTSFYIIGFPFPFANSSLPPFKRTAYLSQPFPGSFKLGISVEEFTRSTPQITEDGGIILGSKKTTVFLVDSKTGRLISSYRSSDAPTASQNNEKNQYSLKTTTGERQQSRFMNLKTDELPLYITRTDFALMSFVPISNKVLWKFTVAEIGAAFLCQGIENSLSGALLDSEPSEGDLHFSMPLPCQSKPVFRLRSHSISESFTRPSRLMEAQHEDMMLTSHHILPSRPKVGKMSDFSSPSSNVDILLESHQDSDTEVVVTLPSLTETSAMSLVQDDKVPHRDALSMLSERFGAWCLFLVIIPVIFATLIGKLKKVNRKEKDQPNALPSKRRKSRKSALNNSIVEKRDSSSNLEDKHTHMENDNTLWLNLNQPSASGMEGRTIGKLFVSTKEIAKGSNGTIVLEGIFEGRPVAVKRIVKAYHDVALKEIQNLIASDRHPNIVRWYGVEYDRDFVYLSLERCMCSLNDLIQIHLDELVTKNQDAETMLEYRVHLDSVKGVVIQDTNLWNANGYPSSILIKLMRDMVSGLVHLHELGIIHRDLKPQNVLIIKERSLCAKLSDMGISKCLVGDMSSLGHHATGYGSSGWQAPEQLLHGRQTRAVDMFSLGCVLFFCITGGKHPFGNRLERDINIAKNHVDLSLVEYVPEAVDLFSHLLDPIAEMRPKAWEVLHHPLFWSSEMRLSFLRDTSDRVELEDRETDSDLLKVLESIVPIALGGKWDEKMEPAFINNIGRYRRYKFDSVRDLLRVMRNKLNHYRELPTEIQVHFFKYVSILVIHYKIECL